MKAKLYLVDDLLIAEMEDGARLSSADALELAKQLWSRGVTSDQISMTDWHEDAARAPTGGQKIAIQFFLRTKENEQTS